MKHFSQLSETFFRKGRFCCPTKTWKKIAKNLEKTLVQQKISNLWYPPLFRPKTRSSGSQSNNKPPHEKKRRIDSTEPIETDSSSEALQMYTSGAFPPFDKNSCISKS